MVRGSILIVEDDHDIRVALRNCLEQEGYFVVSVTNGASALELLQSMSLPNAILLDINMPIMNGDEFLEIFRKKSELSHVPIIQISAGSNVRRNGVVSLLKKPLDVDTLLETLNKFMIRPASAFNVHNGPMRTSRSDSKESAQSSSA